MNPTQPLENKTPECCPVQRLVSPREFASITDILQRDANEIARYHDKHRDAMPPHVSNALCREMTRLRSLADKIKPPTEDEEEG